MWGVGCVGFGATILCVSSRYWRCDSSAAASMAWLVRGRQRWVGREVGPRVSATCRYGLARLRRGCLSIWLGTIGEGLVVDRA